MSQSEYATTFWIPARFIGRDGSLGYETGLVYMLRITRHQGRPTIVDPNPCPYSSWRAFFLNWTFDV